MAGAGVVAGAVDGAGERESAGGEGDIVGAGETELGEGKQNVALRTEARLYAGLSAGKVTT